MVSLRSIEDDHLRVVCVFFKESSEVEAPRTSAGTEESSHEEEPEHKMEIIKFEPIKEPIKEEMFTDIPTTTLTCKKDIPEAKHSRGM